MQIKLFGAGNFSRVLMFCWFLLYAILALTNIQFDGQDKVLGFTAILIALTILFGL